MLLLYCTQAMCLSVYESKCYNWKTGTAKQKSIRICWLTVLPAHYSGIRLVLPQPRLRILRKQKQTKRQGNADRENQSRFQPFDPNYDGTTSTALINYTEKKDSQVLCSQSLIPRVKW